MSESKINEIIRTSLSGIKDMIDVDTIMGEPMAVSGGTTIIPISKVSVGLASGGVDYPSKKKNEAGSETAIGNFGGGGGTGVTLTPVGFLVVKQNGAVDLLSVAASASSTSPAGVVDTVIDVIDRSPELYAKLKSVIMSVVGKSTGDENADPADKASEDIKTEN